jgi:hypothetical protein
MRPQILDDILIADKGVENVVSVPRGSWLSSTRSRARVHELITIIN